MNIEGTKLIKKSLCQQSAFLDDVKFRGPRSLTSYARAIFFETCEQHPFSTWTEPLFYDQFVAELPDKFQPNTIENQSLIQQHIQRFIRFGQFAHAYSLQYLGHNFNIAVETSVEPLLDDLSETIDVAVDLALQQEESGVVFLLNVNFGKSPFVLSTSKHRDANVHQDMTFALLNLAARTYSQTHNVPCAAIRLFLKHRDDKFHHFVYQLDGTRNENWIAYPPGGSETYQTRWEELMMELRQLLTGGGQARCDGRHCENCRVRSICQFKPFVPLPSAPLPTKVKAPSAFKWTEDQEDVIEFESGICRCNAVAGAGKTSLVSGRFIHLMRDRGYDPKTFLFLTFTEKGVEEFKEKLAAWLVTEGLDASLLEQMTITTFNGFGMLLLQQYYEACGFTQTPRLIDRFEQLTVIQTLSETMPTIPSLRYDYPFMNFKHAKGAYFEIIAFFETLREHERMGLTEADELQFATNYDTAIIDLYLAYRRYCMAHALIDFDDQTNAAIDLVSDPDIVAALGFTHIVVDEFQDSNSSQLFIVQQLIEYPKFRSLLVVGDDSQAIYGFRGADQTIILEFDELFENVTDLNLQDNFRTTVEIAEFANHVIKRNKHRLPKSLHAHKHGLEPVILDQRASAHAFLHAVRAEIQAGRQLSEMAVISRNRKTLFEINQLLNEQGIPSLLVVSEKLKDNVQVQRYIAFCRYLLHERSEMALCEYLQFRHYDEFEHETDKMAWFEHRIQRFSLMFDSFSYMEKWRYAMRELEQLALEYDSCRALLDLVRTRGFKSLKEYLTFVKQIEDYDTDYSFYPAQNVDAIILTTAHASKGKEYDVVFCLADTFKEPTKKHRALNPDQFNTEVEEERRLLYVAITRAKEMLYVVRYHDKSSTFFTELETIMSL